MVDVSKPSKISRRNLTMMTLAALPAASLTKAQAGTLDKLTVKLEWTAYVMHLPLHLATVKGWYKDAGLDVTLEDGAGSIEAIQLTGAGRYDLGHGSLCAMAIGVDHGLRLTAISQYLQKNPLGIIYAENAGITSLQSLKGKKLIYTPGSFEAPFILPFLKQNGLSEADVKLVGVQASAKLSSYLAGLGDAVVTTVPADLPHVAARKSGTFLFADYGMNLATFGLFGNDTALKAKAVPIRRFASLVSAAWLYILDGHAQEAAEAVMAQRPNAPTSVQTLVEEFDLYKPYFGPSSSFTGLQTKAAWAATIHEMETAKVIPPGSSPSGYFSNAFIDPAYGKKIVEA